MASWSLISFASTLNTRESEAAGNARHSFIYGGHKRSGSTARMRRRVGAGYTVRTPRADGEA